MKHEKTRTALFTVLVYSTWAILSVGSFFLMFSGRTAILAVLARYSAEGFSQRMLVGTVDKLYMIAAGIAILSYVIIIERYFSNAANGKTLAARALLCVGIEVSALTLFTFMIQLASRTFMGSLSLAITFLLPVAGAAAAYTGSALIRRSLKSNQTTQTFS